MYGGKSSFSIARNLHPDKLSLTIVATGANKLAVIDNGRLRRFILVDFLRMFDYNDNLSFDILQKNIS
jgi:hypothetical protein